MSIHPARPIAKSDEELVRSPCSFEFEAIWRGLRNGGLVPSRSDFHPSKVIRFLPEIVIVEVPGPGDLILKIRLAGSGIEARVQKKITGQNYLDFMPLMYREGALLSARLISSQPCGLWQMTKVHYERGTSQLLEMTAFPLAANQNNAPVILVLSRVIEGFQVPTQTPDVAMLADTAMKFEFLDIGNGVPAWNS